MKFSSNFRGDLRLSTIVKFPFLNSVSLNNSISIILSTLLVYIQCIERKKAILWRSRIKKKIEVIKLKHKRNEIEYNLFKLYKEELNYNEMSKLENELAKINQILMLLADDFD